MLPSGRATAPNRTPPLAPIDALREECLARIKTRLKRINAGKNAGRSLFELADYVACLTVIDSRN